MGWAEDRKELETEYLHRQFLWEEELFSERPDWERLAQQDEELRSWEALLAMLELEELL